MELMNRLSFILGVILVGFASLVQAAERSGQAVIRRRVIVDQREARFGKLAYKGAWTESWPTNLTEKRPPFHPPHVIPPLPEGTPSRKPLSENAASFLVRTVRAHPGEVTILALGPLTNLALAARLDDEFASLAKELVQENAFPTRR